MDEGDTCRICRTGAEEDTPLYHPCKCSGSIAKVHQDCLIEWLQHSKKKSCELCHTELRFHKVYSPSMPVKLPLYLYIRRLILKILQAFRFALRAVFVGTAWLALLPLGNLYIWRLHFFTVDALVWGITGNDVPTPQVRLNASMTANDSSSLATSVFSAANATLTAISSNADSQQHSPDTIRIPFPLLFLDKLIMRTLNHADYRRILDTLAHDTFEGQILTCAVVVLFVALFLLREWCLQNMPQQVDGLQFDPNPPQAPVNRPAIAEAPAFPANRPEDVRPIAAFNQQPAPLAGNPFQDVVVPQEHLREGNGHREQEDDSDVSDNNAATAGSDDNSIDENREERHEAREQRAPNFEAQLDHFLNGLNNEEDEDHQNNNEAEQIDRRIQQLFRPAEDRNENINQAEVQAREPQIRPPPIVMGNQNLANPAPNIDAADWEDEGENGERLEDDLEGMMEAIGMRGPLINLITNMTMMFVLCSFILTVFVALPYGIGRTIGVGHNMAKLVTLPVRLLRLLTDPLVDWMVDYCKSIFVSLYGAQKSQSAGPALVRGAPSILRKWWSGSGNSAAVVLSVKDASGMTGPGQALKTTLFALGGNVLQSSRQVYSELDAKTYARTSSDRAFCIGLGHFYWLIGLAIQNRLSDVYIRWNLRALKTFVDQQIVVLKVLGFIVLELVVFPLCCGILTDLSLHPLWEGVTIHSRIALIQSKPFSVCFTLWSLGTLYMFALAQFVAHTRSIVRPGVLCFVRDAGDPNFHPIKDILERRSLEQLRKIGISGIIYSSILAVTLGLCTRIVAWTTYGILPLNWNVHQTFSSVGFELVGIAVLLPVAAKAWFPGHWLKRAAKRWWRSTAHALSISSYLIGGRYPNEEVPTNSWDSLKGWLLDHLRSIGVVAEQDQLTDENEVTTKGSIAWGGYGRVPADDHAIMSSPLVIRTDASGQPIEARGKEAMKAQVEAIEKVTTKKPQYTVVHLPDQFRARIITLFVAIWLTLCTILLTIFLPPLLIGRSTIQVIKWQGSRNVTLAQQHNAPMHDGLAWFVGCCVFGISHTVGSKLQRMYLKMRTSSNATRRFGKHVRRFLQRCALIFLFGIVTSTSLGILVEMYVNGLTRIFTGSARMPDISLFHVWSMGLMEQHLAYEVVRIRRGRTFRPDWENASMRSLSNHTLGPMYALLDVQNGGWRKPKLMTMIKKAFLPAISIHALAIGVPIFACHLIAKFNKDAAEELRAANISIIYAICLSYGTVSLLLQNITNLMNSWTDILKDEHFLISTELKNYQANLSSENASGDQSNGQATEPANALPDRGDARLNAEGPIPEALLRP
ncbi:uncharacterized protein FA14DRAFT_187648 [Meira miltonrushii]|uniref:RING-type E3 ubiquitin transferase n=1 Tax=Meira miltonrushii TaxID=1280837 RepID=A0A316VJ34_9BASI|nr:uncharacterized protein FA14DRAFT_187648 [Meira miltonrushii]PWN37556.1 hypothetical protein FA14DRAFT_187648 [Meira miltonrushii]